MSKLVFPPMPTLVGNTSVSIDFGAKKEVERLRRVLEEVLEFATWNGLEFDEPDEDDMIYALTQIHLLVEKALKR